MEVVALLIALLAAAAAMYRDPRSPLAWSLCMWAAIFLLYALQPMRLTPLNWVSLTAIGLGLLGLAAPTFLARPRERTVDQGDRRLAFRRFVIVSGVLFVLLVVGVISFRLGIAHAVGDAYESLTLKEVRAAQNTVARGGGLGVLLQALAPVVSCLGVYGAYRFSRWWWLLSAASFVLMAQNPARINLLTLLVVTVIFWLYARATLAKDEQPPGRQPFPLSVYIVLAAAVVGGIIYFTVVGASLSKNDTANAYTNWLPTWIASPVLYFLGGIAAFSSAVDIDAHPFQWGTTIYTPLKLIASVFPGVHEPNTIGAEVRAPMPINVYSGFGQIWFDFGFIGVAVFALLFGALTTYAHRRGEQGSVEWGWVMAATSAILFSLPQAVRILNLDVLFTIAAGVVAFYVIRWPGIPFIRSRRADDRTPSEVDSTT